MAHAFQNPLVIWLLIPLLVHFGVIAGLYVLLTWARLVVVRRGEAVTADFASAGGDPRFSARIQRNLANQFEAPVFAWIGALLLVLTERVGAWDVAAAWLFLAGRILHSWVQCSGDNVVLRGQVFTVNFVAVLWLMTHATWAVLVAPT